MLPKRSRICMQMLPRGNAAWAMRAVSSGIGGIGVGCSVMADSPPSEVRPLYTPRGPPLLACHEFANSINSGLHTLSLDHIDQHIDYALYLRSQGKIKDILYVKAAAIHQGTLPAMLSYRK